METRRTFTQEIAVPGIAVFETVKILHTTPNIRLVSQIASCSSNRNHLPFYVSPSHTCNTNNLLPVRQFLEHFFLKFQFLKITFQPGNCDQSTKNRMMRELKITMHAEQSLACWLGWPMSGAVWAVVPLVAHKATKRRSHEPISPAVVAHIICWVDRLFPKTEYR